MVHLQLALACEGGGGGTNAVESHKIHLRLAVACEEGKRKVEEARTPSKCDKN